MKNMRRYEKSSLKHIVQPNDNFLEQEFENFNQGGVDNKEPLGR